MKICSNKLKNLVLKKPSLDHHHHYTCITLNLRKLTHIRLLTASLLIALLLLSALLHTLYATNYSNKIEASDLLITLTKLADKDSFINFAKREPDTKADPVLVDTSIDCDRSHFRTDVCVVRGDVRVFGTQVHEQPHPRYTVLQVVHEASNAPDATEREELIRPYTRKWEEAVMKRIDEVKIKRQRVGNSTTRSMHKCDIRHHVPGVVFSTGGYTGNVYHEFNDGLIPLYLSVGHLGGEVVLVVLEYHKWWMTKYNEIIQRLTHYKVVNLSTDRRVHCFTEIKVGLNIQNELTIQPSVGLSDKVKIWDDRRNNMDAIHRLGRLTTVVDPRLSMQDFQDNILRPAYVPKRESSLTKVQLRTWTRARIRVINSTNSSYPRLGPKLVVISRKSPRALLNEKDIVKLAAKMGYVVSVVTPKSSTEMADIYWDLNTCDVMLGVHGAAMTHLLFMRPGSTFIQIVPIGTEWAATTYYGEPAQKLGLDYVEYKVKPRESSLWKKYGPRDPVLADPASVNSKGWWETKRVYLEGQDVTISLESIRPILRQARARHASSRA